MSKYASSLALIVLLGLSLSLRADRLVMSDGSVINGTIKSIAGGSIVVSTAFAGEIKIDAKQVSTMTTDKAVNVATADGARHAGKITATADGACTMNQSPVDVKNIKHLWLEGAQDPTLPPGRKWSGEVAVDIGGQSGNSEKFNAGSGFVAKLAGPDDKLTLSALINFDRKDGETVTEKYLAGMDYERSIAASPFSWYSRLEFEKKETSGLDLRSELTAGCGYHIIDLPKTKLRSRLGLSGTARSYTDNSHDDAMGMEAGLFFEHTFDEWCSLQSQLTWNPKFDRLDDYRLKHVSALDIPLVLKVPLSLRLGMSNEYNSIVGEDVDRLETVYFLKVVYKWK